MFEAVLVFCAFVIYTGGNKTFNTILPGATQGFLAGLFIASDDYLIANSMGSGYRVSRTFQQNQ